MGKDAYCTREPTGKECNVCVEDHQEVLKFLVPTVPFSFILSMDTPSIPYIITVVLYRMFFFRFIPQSLFAQKY